MLWGKPKQELVKQLLLTATFNFLLKHSQQPNTQPRFALWLLRELAIQIFNDAKAMAESTGLRVGLVYGGEVTKFNRKDYKKALIFSLEQTDV